MHDPTDVFYVLLTSVRMIGATKCRTFLFCRKGRLYRQHDYLAPLIALASMGEKALRLPNETTPADQ